MPTNFQIKVYSLLKKIPKGKVTTYKILAQQLNIKAYQAIGTACKNNPFFPNIPCHRVVCADGAIGGYQGKLNHPRKIELLEKEGLIIKKQKITNFKEHLFKF
jgi:methylated-DNA-[protein]-cysteine S-methyltransferase